MNAVTDCMAMIADIAGTIAKPQTIFEACVEAARPFNADDIESTGARMKLLCDMENEPDDKARDVPLCDMNEAELCAVILHDPDLSQRRTALGMLKQHLLLEAQTRTFTLLGEMQKERRK